MSSELSLRDAATQHGDALGLFDRGLSYTYRELALRCEQVSLPTPNLHRASASLQSALVLYRSLEERKPLCLLSATASDDEAQRLAARLPHELSEDTALVLFTSGSGGLAKGVKLSRRALLASARASEARLGWFGSDRWLCTLPLCHIGGLSILLRCLVSRKTAYLCETFETSKVVEAIVDHKITHLSLVPTMLWRLVESGFRAPEHLQVTLMGGAAVSEDLAARARAAGFRLRLSYGMTETASQIVTDGHALDGVMLRVVDGCLEIKAPMLMDGYLSPHIPERLTASSWFRTQDRARIDDAGLLRILGRADDLIISGGENIDPREVEAGLNACASIATSYAFALPHAEWGQELVALVVPSDPAASQETLQSHALRGHRRPKLLVPVAALPLLENGKIDRVAATRLVQQTRDR